MTNKRIHQIYGIVLSVVAVIAGICLMVACVGIYNSGDRPYSPEAVRTAFSAIAVPVYIFLALMIGGFILDGFFPVPKAKSIPPKQYDSILGNLSKNADPALLDNHFRKKRVLFGRISLVLLAVGSSLFLAYALDGSHFAIETINSAMTKATVWLLVCMTVPFGFAVFTAYYAKASIQKEIDLLKSAGVTPSRSPAAPAKDLSWIRWAILGIASVCIVLGLFTGGTKDVLTKAVNICTECIGLG